MQRILTSFLLVAVKAVSRLLWRYEVSWVGTPPAGDRWTGIRLVVLLNHTSLYEWVFAALPPNRWLRKLAAHGVVPVAAKTLKRPWVGRFFGLVAAHVVPVSGQRDDTWRTMLEKVDDPKAMVVILPEGRMMRRNGLDKEGRPMTIRGGVADILLARPDGRMLLAYSGGLHHVQAPGEHFPRLFRTVRMSFELVEIPEYRRAMLERSGGDEKAFRTEVMADLERRLLAHCPVRPGTAHIPLRPVSRAPETPAPRRR
jgi:1-acyl-sn-glycerol-3-phosphate acyltransferase